MTIMVFLRNTMIALKCKRRNFFELFLEKLAKFGQAAGIGHVLGF
jgi:hypothetical protein